MNRKAEWRKHRLETSALFLKQEWVGCTEFYGEVHVCVCEVWQSDADLVYFLKMGIRRRYSTPVPNQ